MENNINSMSPEERKNDFLLRTYNAWKYGKVECIQPGTTSIANSVTFIKFVDLLNDRTSNKLSCISKVSTLNDEILIHYTYPSHWIITNKKVYIGTNGYISDESLYIFNISEIKMIDFDKTNISTALFTLNDGSIIRFKNIHTDIKKYIDQLIDIDNSIFEIKKDDEIPNNIKLLEFAPKKDNHLNILFGFLAAFIYIILFVKKGSNSQAHLAIAFIIALAVSKIYKFIS